MAAASMESRLGLGLETIMLEMMQYNIQ